MAKQTKTEQTTATKSKMKAGKADAKNLGTIAEVPAVETANKGKDKKTPAPKATATPSTNGHAKKDGLRKPQIRILQALSKVTNRGMTRKEIAEKAPVDLAFCVEYIGSLDPIRRAKNDAKFPSLLTLKFVREAQPESDEGGQAYEITALGKKALEKALAE